MRKPLLTNFTLEEALQAKSDDCIKYVRRTELSEHGGMRRTAVQDGGSGLFKIQELQYGFRVALRERTFQV